MKEKFRKLLCDIAVLSKSDVSIEIIQHYILRFERIGFDVGIKGLCRWLDEFDERSIFPSIRKVAALGGSPIPEAAKADDTGIEVADKIIGAISKYGLYNPDRAKNYIGELGWTIVERLGGWSRVCDIQNSEINNFKAQIREAANSLFRKSNNYQRLINEKGSHLKLIE